ncbi:hypothetical protein L1887_62286 [Cichorium endivia]|nr:hypothetical protein L1887_62286 [Cichorium endivia]
MLVRNCTSAAARRRARDAFFLCAAPCPRRSWSRFKKKKKEKKREITLSFCRHTVRHALRGGFGEISRTTANSAAVGGERIHVAEQINQAASINPAGQTDAV